MLPDESVYKIWHREVGLSDDEFRAAENHELSVDRFNEALDMANTKLCHFIGMMPLGNC